MVTVYRDEYCETYYEGWDDFKAHMIAQHGLDESSFVDAEEEE